MPFIPHTAEDVRLMLDALGADSIEDLFDEIPAPLRAGRLQQVPEGRSERDAVAEVRRRLEQDPALTCFAGAGAYDHYVPAAVWDLATRGEFMTAYTPYQAEASQGTLQLLYEYQTMMSRLTGMDVSNASLYDGASALAEAVLMAVRAQRKSGSRRILLAGSVHPNYRATAASIVSSQEIELETLVFCESTGRVEMAALQAHGENEYAALVVQSPNFFGGLEAVDELTDWAHARGMLVIAVVNPMTLAVLKPPGAWGETGADIVVGDGQPLGLPLSSGGPYFGFMCARQKIVRQMPGRIIGRTVDLDGREGFALTLQAREQHIRRSKATSNICTNQGLAVTAATVFLSLLGPQGLQEMARASYQRSAELVAALTDVEGVHAHFSGPRFHECVLRLPVRADSIVDRLAQEGVLAGVALGYYFPGLENCLLTCATEQRSAAEIAHFAGALRRVLEEAV